MNVKRVYRKIKSLPAGAGAVLTAVFLALVMTLTAAADDPAPERPSGVCGGACGPLAIAHESVAFTRPFDEPAAVVSIVRGAGDDRIWASILNRQSPPLASPTGA